MIMPTGEQYVIASHGYRAVVTQTGVLRELRHDGRDLVDGFDEDAMPLGVKSLVALTLDRLAR